MNKVEYRQPERNAWCRVCETQIRAKQDYMISWYSTCNRGQYIHICPGCVKSLYEMLPKDE